MASGSSDEIINSSQSFVSVRFTRQIHLLDGLPELNNHLRHGLQEVRQSPP